MSTAILGNLWRGPRSSAVSCVDLSSLQLGCDSRKDRKPHSLGFGKHFSQSHLPGDGIDLDEQPRDALTQSGKLPILNLRAPSGFRMNIARLKIESATLACRSLASHVYF